MKTSNAKKFTGILRGGGHKPTNSGILSNSGAGQKSDGLPKPSYGKKASKSVVRKAVDSMNHKVGRKSRSSHGSGHTNSGY